MDRAPRFSRLGVSTFLATAVGGVVSPQLVFSQAIPAFSGADGAGAYATGGRGGVVYHVTTLDAASDRGSTSLSDYNARPGTLRYGLNDANFTVNGVVQKRTIVFDVGGTVWLGRKGEVQGWDSASNLSTTVSNITIAGQTAPGGVTFMGAGLKFGNAAGTAGNMIVRNITVAPGYGMRGLGTDGVPDTYVFDAMNISAKNTIIDHVSTFFATDETISLDERAKNVTIQYSTLAQGQNYPQFDVPSGPYTGHAFGSLNQPGQKAEISFHHNLWAHLKGRLPRVGTSQPSDWTTTNPGETFVGAYNDFRNNVFYNWLGTAGTGASGQQSNNNFVGNAFLSGNGGDNPVGESTQVANGTPGITNASGGTVIFDGASTSATRVYQSGNVKDLDRNTTITWSSSFTAGTGTSGDFRRVTVSSEFAPVAQYYGGVTDTGAAAFDRVLNYAGSNWWTRDSVINTVDERIISETRGVTGKIIAWADDPSNPNDGAEWNALRNQATISRAANWDTEDNGFYATHPTLAMPTGDGMPTWWELKHGLDPSVSDHNGDFDNDGYTNLEEYLNEIAEWPAPNAVTFTGSTNTRFAQINNWHLKAVPTTLDLWQPNKYDTAQINTGTVVVDAVGQHAGVLKIAAATGQSASMSVTAGWLEIADKLQVGAGGTGTVNHSGGMVVAAGSVVIGAVAGSSGTYNLSGGRLDTPLLTKGPGGGTFNFTGGELHADTVNFTLVNNGGIIAPGQSPGHTAILGNLVMNSGGIEIELASGTTFDTLSATGLATLGGSLYVELLDGYLPLPGDYWTIMIADGGFAGSFASITPGYETMIIGNALILTAVPEPTALAVLGLGAAALLRRRRS